MTPRTVAKNLKKYSRLAVQRHRDFERGGPFSEQIQKEMDAIEKRITKAFERAKLIEFMFFRRKP